MKPQKYSNDRFQEVGKTVRDEVNVVVTFVEFFPAFQGLVARQRLDENRLHAEQPRDDEIARQVLEHRCTPGVDAMQARELVESRLRRLGHEIRRDDVEKAMDEALLEIIPRLEKRTHYLSSLANIGLLTGLLGTVIGLIAAFTSIASASPAEKASMLSASISVAMNNTASWLFVAITLLLGHMFLEAKTTKVIDSLEIASVKFLNSVVERRSEPEGNAPAPRGGMAPARGWA